MAAYLWKREADVRKQGLTDHEIDVLGTLDPSLPNSHLSRSQFEEYRGGGRTPRSLASRRGEVGVVALVWATYYRRVVEVRAPDGPPILPTMERLVQDFIARGGR